uniref:Uncharacterized protein n=1 Tax=Percolomonas cosmopolitus TaxID=63605 RepID=A0A7S1PFA4_9EUKA|mmetsp:Transcript_10655/g.39771  ORF Transcript_10655/g.39771 Transcript_10655/m.39771 type:complete len:394 (+) Transcript_10655:266-1447(+)
MKRKRDSTTSNSIESATSTEDFSSFDLDSSEAGVLQTLKRKKSNQPRKPKRTKKRQFKVASSMYAKAQNATQLVQSLQKTGLTSDEIKSLCQSTKKNRAAVLPSKDTLDAKWKQERFAEREARMKFLWQQVVYRLCYKMFQVKKSTAFTDQQKQSILQNIQLKKIQLNQILDMLRELTVLEQVQDELYRENLMIGHACAGASQSSGLPHGDIVENTLAPFETMMPKLHLQLSHRMKMPFQHTGESSPDTSSPFMGNSSQACEQELRTTPKRGRKKSKVPFKNITNESQHADAEISMFENDRWKQNAEKRVLNIPSTRRVAHAAEKKTVSDDKNPSGTKAPAKTLPLKRTAPSGFGGIGSRRKRRRRDAGVISSLALASAEDQVHFEVPETTYG